MATADMFSPKSRTRFVHPYKGGKTMLKKFRKSEKGFTLIELLIVVAIIGILAAIAIPQFASYRKKAFDSAAASDLKTMRTELEGYYTDNFRYPNAAL
jgi:prepilin-type N-terminal cleavage/methylation domain-containing protein